MNGLSGLLDNWYDLTIEGRKRFLSQFFDELLRDIPRYENYITDILNTGTDYEQNDYFGTEGFRF